MRKVSSQILVKIICVKFHQNRPQDAATKGCYRHTYTHTDAQTGLIPGVNIFSNEMTEYKKPHKYLNFSGRSIPLHVKNEIKTMNTTHQ